MPLAGDQHVIKALAADYHPRTYNGLHGVMTVDNNSRHSSVSRSITDNRTLVTHQE